MKWLVGFAGMLLASSAADGNEGRGLQDVGVYRDRDQIRRAPSTHGHLDGIGLDLILASLASDDERDLGSDGTAERHRRTRLGFHP